MTLLKKKEWCLHLETLGSIVLLNKLSIWTYCLIGATV